MMKSNLGIFNHCIINGIDESVEELASFLTSKVVACACIVITAASCIAFRHPINV